jgi:hypothetical protein
MIIGDMDGTGSGSCSVAVLGICGNERSGLCYDVVYWQLLVTIQGKVFRHCSHTLHRMFVRVFLYCAVA